MTVDHHELYVPGGRVSAPPRSGLRRFLVELAPQDWLVLAYFLVLNISVLFVPPSEARWSSFAPIFFLGAAFTAVCVLVRTETVTNGFLAPFSYRVTALFCVEGSYFAFADYLPIVNTAVLDQPLYDLDMVLFGMEPAMVFDRYVSSTTTEWFSFFYFGYFIVLGGHVLPILFFCRRSRVLGEFALGTLLVFCIGHTLYMIVPGYGPYKAMPEAFQNELPSGIWWNMTAAIVAESGAQKDIFPSLHTAAPTFMLLFSFHNRRCKPFNLTWPLTAFFTANIIIATMFLRWHYVIDVVAGLLLALFAQALSVKVVARELKRRQALGLRGMWPEWFPNRPRGVGCVHSDAWVRPLTTSHTKGEEHDRDAQLPAQNPS